jgi:uncharacterized protein
MHLAPKTYDGGDIWAVQALYHSNGWTHGLPIVPPTPDVPMHFPVSHCHEMSGYCGSGRAEFCGVGMNASNFLRADEIDHALESRLGRVHARQRLGIEKDHEAQAFGQGLTFLHVENLPITHAIIRTILCLSGMYGRGRANAARVRLRNNEVFSERLAWQFDGFTILHLHLSDLHADISAGAMAETARLVSGLRYDLCILTGDYRGLTFGSFYPCLREMLRLREVLRCDIYGVLGNHDTVLMVPDLERMGIRVLLNEHAVIQRDGSNIFLAGIDDAHFYRVDNIEKAAAEMPQDAFSILLSHTPETYREASHAGFDLLLAGHTHGGQICLPGGTPITLASALPRSMGRGPWKYRGMAGYTSVGAGSCGVPVRFNCPPEITLHHLRRTACVERHMAQPRRQPFALVVHQQAKALCIVRHRPRVVRVDLVVERGTRLDRRRGVEGDVPPEIVAAGLAPENAKTAGMETKTDLPTIICCLEFRPSAWT